MKKIKKIAIAGAVLWCSALLVSNSFANEDSDVNNDHNSTTTTTGSYNPETKTFVNNNASSVLTLKWRIDWNYKVMLKWNPLSSEVENYILLFSSTNSEPTYPIMEWDKVITIDSNKTETVDWSSKKWVNYYRLWAIDTNGNVTLSNTIKIMMDWNWKPVYDESMLKENNSGEHKEYIDRKPEMWDNHWMDKRPEMWDDHWMDRKPEMKDKREEYKKEYNQTSSWNYENKDKMQYFKNNVKPKQSLKDIYIKQLREKYSTLINNIPSEKLSLVLDKINSKIDSITNSDLKQDTKEKSLAMLNALVVLINERLDSFDTDSLVQDLLK